MYIILTVVTLFQLFPARAAVFVGVGGSFFLIAPWLNGKNHWESHLELALVFFLLCAAAEQVREKRNDPISSLELKVKFFFPLLCCASFVWFFVGK